MGDNLLLLWSLNAIIVLQMKLKHKLQLLLIRETPQLILKTTTLKTWRIDKELITQAHHYILPVTFHSYFVITG